MVDEGQNGHKELSIDSDALKFASWSIRRIIHGVSGRRFGTLELDEQMGTAINAVLSAAKPTVTAGQRIGSAAAGAAWRAIRDIARSLDVTDLEIARNPSPSQRQHPSEPQGSSRVIDDEKTDKQDRRV